jgi:hypothetical protein
LFSLLGGLVFALGGNPLADTLGIPYPGVLTPIGVVLIVYAGSLFWTATRDPLPHSLALTAVVLDVVWVLGSVVLLLSDVLPLTTVGRWTVLLLADAVLAFAVLQAYGIWRSR